MVKPGLYVVPGGGSNSIVRVTPEGVILVDTKLPGEANYTGCCSRSARVTPLPVKIVIVTHHHADHTGNNDRFIAAGAEVIGHAVLASSLDTYQFDPRPAKPTATYDGASASCGWAASRCACCTSDVRTPAATAWCISRT